MKTFRLSFFALTFSFLWLSGYSQSQVNLNWNENFGSPDTSFSWNSSKIDAAGNLLTVGNTIVAGEGTNLLLTCHDDEGNMMWESDHDNSARPNQFGIALAEDASGNIYVCGATTTGVLFGAGSDSDYLLVKYNSQGAEQWARTYNGPDDEEDVAFAITVSNSGDVFITGMSTGDTTGRDFATIKYNSSGTQQWVARYNRNNLEDVGAWITTDIYGNVYVTGASGTTTTDWDIATLIYTSSGTQVHEEIFATPGYGYDRPVELVVDLLGNAYITGTTSLDGIDYDIITIKLDSNYQVKWVQIHDESGYVDEASSMAVNASGDVFVTGFVTKPDGQSLVAMKYDSTGNLEWKEDLGEGFESQGHDIMLDSNGDVVISGQHIKSTGKDAIAVCFNSDGNLTWMETYPTNDQTSESSAKISLGSQGNVYVSSLSQETGSPSYAIQQYENINYTPEAVLDQSGDPTHIKNEVIIRFDTSSLILAPFENPEIEFGEAKDFIKASVIQTMENKLGMNGELDNATVIKIFPNLLPTDTISVTRLGDTIPVPTFWSALTLILPEDASKNNLDELSAADSLNSLQPEIWYAEINAITFLDGIPNDSFYTSNQFSLYPSVLYPFAHINIESAWDIETGKDYVKVGVFDSGIGFGHQDFVDGSTSGEPALSGTVVDGGKNYISGAPIHIDPGAALHGTTVSGIIGAVRDNNIGIAGAAGGGNGLSGVRLFAMRVHSDTSTFGASFTEAAITRAAQATLDGTLSTNHGGFGLHIMNNSWGTNEVGNTINKLLEEQVEFAFKNQVIYVASRGNSPTSEPRFPATFDDKWVISVGANGANGQKTLSSSTGRGLDFLAPGVDTLILTTNNTTNSSYSSFDGTSAAAPHVSGVAGLILSYLNVPAFAGFRTAPEDVEFLLQKYADDKATPGYDDQSGWGLINAGKTMQMIEKPVYQISHLPISTATIRTNANQGNVTVELTGYENLTGGQYIAEKWLITETHNHNLNPSDSIIDAWVRNSSSEGLSGVTSPLDTKTDVNFTYNNTQANFSGYSYKILQKVGSSAIINKWIPAPPDDIKFAYTIHFKDLLATSRDEELLDNSLIKLFPNPANNEITIQTKLDNPVSIKIEILDVTGKLYKSESYKDSLGEFIQQIPISHLPVGIYICRVWIENKIYNKKIIKSDIR